MGAEGGGRMKRVINRRRGKGREKRNEKRDLPPKTPLESKESKREYYRGSLNPVHDRARARTRYREAGAAADELIDLLGGSPVRDRRIWAYYCYHHDIGIILDRAYEYASMHRQGEIRNPVTAFQRWLQKSFGKEAA